MRNQDEAIGRTSTDKAVAPPKSSSDQPVAGEGSGSSRPTVSATGQANKKRGSGTSSGRLKYAIIRLAVLLAFLSLWEFSSGRWVDEILVSKPSAVYERLSDWITDGSLFYHGVVTLRVAGLGFLVGTGIALLVALILGRVKPLGRVLQPFITAAYSLPRLAVAPLLILWFGIGDEFKVVLTAVLVFFLMFSTVYTGVQAVDSRLINAVKIMGAGRLHIFRYVILPSALSWIATGLTICIPYSLVGAVVGEILAANRGLGFLVSRSAAQFNTSGTFATLSVLVAVGYIANAFAGATTRRALRWQEAGAREANAARVAQ
ncbi:ABC transporter permease [Actinophytocola sp.]|uniref:ABC transporter permease n=1 Tax=Actinophytocola sp. TaxID=1872138 RepID=UPI003D6A9330